MIVRHGEYEVDDARERFDVPRVFDWLATTYWSLDLTPGQFRRAVYGSSLAVGVYLKGEQVGCLRVVSDRATFAWIADVFVTEAHRRRGLAQAMVRYALRHPDHQGLRRWMLATRDAHAVYQSLGFMPLPTPDQMMIFRPGGSPISEG